MVQHSNMPCSRRQHAARLSGFIGKRWSLRYRRGIAITAIALSGAMVSLAMITRLQPQYYSLAYIDALPDDISPTPSGSDLAAIKVAIINRLANSPYGITLSALTTAGEAALEGHKYSSGALAADSVRQACDTLLHSSALDLPLPGLTIYNIINGNQHEGKILIKNESDSTPLQWSDIGVNGTTYTSKVRLQIVVAPVTVNGLSRIMEKRRSCAP